MQVTLSPDTQKPALPNLVKRALSWWRGRDSNLRPRANVSLDAKGVYAKGGVKIPQTILETCGDRGHEWFLVKALDRDGMIVNPYTAKIDWLNSPGYGEITRAQVGRKGRWRRVVSFLAQ